MAQVSSNYLLAGQASELERLQLQSRVWEPAGRALLERLPRIRLARALDVGCGAMGWLRILAEWVGENGTVIGTDIDDGMLAAARSFADSERLINVTLAKDDLFDSKLERSSFDLVHARFQIAPLGQGARQVGAFCRLVKPGGWLVLEDPDMGSWHVSPHAPSVDRLIALIREGFLAAGGNFDSGRDLPTLMRGAGLHPIVFATVVALETGHPYLRLPLQFAKALRPRLEKLIKSSELDELVTRADEELSREGTWGTTFTLIQAYAQMQGRSA
jgi:SAM-dependent methyltransferase